MTQQESSIGHLLNQANQLKLLGKLDQAIALYQQLIEVNPNFAWAYYDLGETLAQKNGVA